MKNIVRIFKNILVFIIPSLVVIHSCVNTDYYDLDKISDEIEINPSVSAPFLNFSMTVEDLFNEIHSNDNTGIFSDGLVYITFSDQILSYPASEILDIPDQSLLQLYLPSEILSNPLWASSPVGDTVMFSKQLKSEYISSHNEKMDSVKVKSTSLLIDLSSSFRNYGFLRVHSQNIRSNGVALDFIIPISKADGTFSLNNLTVLNNLTFILDNSDPTKTTLPVSFDLFLVKSGSAVSPGQQLNISMTYRNIEFSSAFGYLGEYVMPVEQGSIDLEFFNKLTGGGEILFADPRISIYTDNSFGVPVELSLTDVSAYSETKNITTDITLSNSVNPFRISIPAHIGESSKDSLFINKDNCNIVQAMGTSPSVFNYKVNARTNPSGISGPYNFITDTSRLNMDLEFLLPLWIKANAVTITDTMEFDIGDVSDIMNYLRFTIQGENAFPLKGGLKLFFADSLYNLLDSLMFGNPVLFDGASVGSNGKVTVPANFKKTATLNKQKIGVISDAKYIIAKASFNTTPATPGDYVKFYSYYKLNFKLSLKAELSINSRELND